MTGGIETVTAELMRFCPDDAATSRLLFPFRSQSFFPEVPRKHKDVSPFRLFIKAEWK